VFPHLVGGPPEQEGVAHIEAVRGEACVLRGREHRVNDVAPGEGEEVARGSSEFPPRGLVTSDLAALLRYAVIALRHLSADAEGSCLSEREHRHDRLFRVPVRSHKIVGNQPVTLDVIDRRLRRIRDLLCDGQEGRMYRAVLVRPGAGVRGAAQDNERFSSG